MTTTRTGQQPAPPDARLPAVTAPAMEPIEIAWNRLTDYAQGAYAELFGRLDAEHIANRLAYLEDHYDGLRRAVDQLGQALDPLQLQGTTEQLLAYTRAYELTVKELHQP